MSTSTVHDEEQGIITYICMGPKIPSRTPAHLFCPDSNTVTDIRAERLMEEVCIVIDEQDKVLGTGSKRKCM